MPHRHAFPAGACMLVLLMFTGAANAQQALAVGGGGGGQGAASGGIGQTASNGQAGGGQDGGAGGVNGYGGGAGSPDPSNNAGAGGAGLFGDGASTNGGNFITQAAQGGFSAPSFAGGAGDGYGTQFSNGGFGGGGGGGVSGGGGGGGYSGGGGGSDNLNGGGGGSFLGAGATATSLMGGANSGNGYITINGMMFNYSGAAAFFTVTTTGIYDIVAAGAQGGVFDNPQSGFGAIASGDFDLTAGTELELIVGGMGSLGDETLAGGGGGSFVLELSSVPEPASLLGLGAGVLALGMMRLRRRA